MSHPMGESSIRWRGVFIIPVTPFLPDLSLDLESMARQIEFCIACGVQGIVAPGVSGEFYTLSDAERIQLFEAIAEQVAGRLPFVACVSASSAPHAAFLARAAQDAGADGLMAMPPLADKGSFARTLGVFKAICEAAPLPLVLQNTADMGSALTLAQMGRIVAELPLVQVVKEETAPNPQRVGEVVTELGTQLKAVFGGQGGNAFFNELSRGAHGTMPASQFSDLYVRMFSDAEADRLEAARQLFDRMAPALLMERGYGIPFKKECLRRRGVIAHTAVRAGQPALDRQDLVELDRIWENLAPLFSTGVQPS